MNKSELICGGILGLGFFWAIGLWCIPLAIVTSILWAMGGAGIWGTKAWRRIGVPIVVAISLVSIGVWIRLVSGVLTAIILSIGYGQRSTQPPDDGSLLGNFWLDRLGEKRGMIASRATIIIGIWAVWFIAHKISF